MQFITDIANTDKNVVILFEYDLPLVDVDFSPHDPGIWSYQITPDAITVTDDYGITGYYENQNTTIYDRIKSVRVDNQRMTEAESYSDMYLQSISYYYDFSIRTIYFHFADFDWPLDKIVRLGAPMGYCSDPGSGDFPYWGSGDELHFYAPRLLSVPSLKTKKDPLFFGKFNFIPQKAKLSNSNNDFDNFDQQHVYGQQARYYLGLDDYSLDDFYQVSEAYIEDFKYNWSELNINLQDLRKRLAREIPINSYTVAEYQYLNESNDGKKKPTAWGSITNAPTVCLDETDTLSDYTFSFVDGPETTPQSLTTVYAKNGDVIDEVIPSNVDLDAGTFTLSDSDCFDGDSLLEITCDFVGLLNDGMDIIKDIIGRYDNTPYLASNFNTTEWEESEPFSKNCGVYIKDKKKIYAIIKKLCESINSVFYPTRDGKWSMKIYQADRTPSGVIYDWQYHSEPEFSHNYKEYLSSVTIKYNKDQTTDEYNEYTNKDYENQALIDYGSYQEKTFESLLTTQADAITQTQTILDISKDIVETVGRSTGLEFIEYEVMDFIITSHHRDYEEPDYKIYEILEKSPDLDKKQIKWKMRYVSDSNFNGEFLVFGGKFDTDIFKWGL